MAQEMSGDTPVEAVLGQEIEYRGDTFRVTKTTEDGSVAYRVEWLDDEGNVTHENRPITTVPIGCPRCKQNQRASFEDGEYVCPCGYSNQLTLGKLLAPVH